MELSVSMKTDYISTSFPWKSIRTTAFLFELSSLKKKFKLNFFNSALMDFPIGHKRFNYYPLAQNQFQNKQSPQNHLE